MSSSYATKIPVKRACDSCHRRKVKCVDNVAGTCRQCISAGISCTYFSVPQKKGPKGRRAKVLTDIHQSQLVMECSGLMSSSALLRVSGLVTSDMINACIEYYFDNVYPILPILPRTTVYQARQDMDNSVESYHNILALCAYVLLQPSMIWPPQARIDDKVEQPSNTELVHLLLDEAAHLQKPLCDYERITTLNVCTSYFVFGCYLYLGRQDAAWIHLRQASTIVHLLGLQDESASTNSDVFEDSCNRRLFWIILVTERVYAFKRHLPLTFYNTTYFPSVDDNSADEIQFEYFKNLVKLYEPFNERFFGFWNQTNNTTSPALLVQLQKQLSETPPDVLEGSEVHVADLQISRHWLKIMIWTLASRDGYLTSVPPDPTLSFYFPIEVARDLIDQCENFSRHTLELHGIPMVEKLFDIACTLIEVMATPYLQYPFYLRPEEYLKRFLRLLSALHGGQVRYLSLLHDKIAENWPGYLQSLCASLTCNEDVV